MMENILETAKSFFNLEGISHSIVIIGAIVGTISFIGKRILKCQKRRNQKKYLQQRILKWHEGIQNPGKLPGYRPEYGSTPNKARIEITKELFEDLKLAAQEENACLNEKEKKKFRRALSVILRRNEDLQHRFVGLSDFPIGKYEEIFEKFKTELPWLKL